MLESGYFDSEITGYDEEGMPIFDRARSSDFLAMFISQIISDGVLALPGDCFQVIAHEGLKLKVRPGFGIVRGRFAWDKEEFEIELSEGHASYRRIDRVILRANYLQRLCEIIVREGVPGARPDPPELIRPAAGDYYELCLATVSVNTKQTVITQADITDTRYDSRVCGAVTQVIDHLDTSVFFAQLNEFYKEFVDKSETSYEEFRQMAQTAYQNFTSDISQYIATLKQDSTDAYNNLLNTMNSFYNTLSQQGQNLHDQYAAEMSEYLTELETKGNNDLLAITQQLILFKSTNEAEFLEWFEHIKGTLGEDAAGALQNQTDALSAQIQDLQSMLISGMVRAKLKTDQDDFITDSTGKPLLIGWPICGCNK